MSTPPTYVNGHGLLTGKKVLVTAAAGTGIGFQAAKRAIEEGAQVVISDKHERRCGESAAELGVVGIPCDVTVEDDVQALVKGAAEALGGIDIFINNAGLGGEVPIVEMTDDQWSLVLDVTLNGTFRCMRAEMKYLYANGGGVIVNNASVLGCAAIEAAPHDVRINAVAPSLAMHPFLAKATTEETLAELTKREAFGRAAEPWEVANVMMFLASDYSSYMTGEIVSVSSQRA